MSFEKYFEQNLDPALIHNYLSSLVNRFFKILPIRENGEESLATYIRSLQMELVGCAAIIIAFNEDPAYLSLLSILQYLVDNPETELKEVRREVFHAINICNKLKSKYSEGEVSS